MSPPYTEAVTGAHNSFTCNLPRALQAEKIPGAVRHDRAEFRISSAGVQGRTIRVGAATVAIIDTLGFHCGRESSPRFDFSNQQGPDFQQFDSQPFFLSETLLEVPCTIEYVGWAGGLKATLHGLAETPLMRRLRGHGVLARTGAVNRIMLSPEGNTFDEMRQLTEALLEAGQRTFTLSFHSPSLDVGHTPYVRSQRDLDVFLRQIEAYCESFFSHASEESRRPSKSFDCRLCSSLN